MKPCREESDAIQSGTVKAAGSISTCHCMTECCTHLVLLLRIERNFKEFTHEKTVARNIRSHLFSLYSALVPNAETVLLVFGIP